MSKMQISDIDGKYMRRALQLASGGEGAVSPNPMVGAVIVADGRIIGEGFHRRWGEAHAEVNAVRSVSPADRHLLPQSTMYVTLEPCSHYGKTPPCSRLIIREGIPRIVVGSLDPFPEVSGRGVRMLREAGREVATGILEKECMALNKVFMTAHTLGRPFVRLKWAETADGFIGIGKDGKRMPVGISDALGLTHTHRLRAASDAILIGTGTLRADNPSLGVRFWPGRDPLRLLMGTPRQEDMSLDFFRDDNFMLLPHVENSEGLLSTLRSLYSGRGITSVLVEGGSGVLDTFLNTGLWDEIRVERSSRTLADIAGDGVNGVSAPHIPDGAVEVSALPLRDSIIFTYSNKTDSYEQRK